jgi:hypothetical protein
MGSIAHRPSDLVATPYVKSASGRKLSWPLRVVFASRPFLIDQRQDRGLPIHVVLFVVGQ